VVFQKYGGSPQKDSLEKSENRASGAAPAKNENDLFVSTINRVSEPSVIVTIVSIWG